MNMRVRTIRIHVAETTFLRIVDRACIVDGCYTHCVHGYTLGRTCYTCTKKATR